METLKILSARDVWVAQLVQLPTLDFGWGHDLGVMGLNPASGPTLSMELACPTFKDLVNLNLPQPTI